jgi:hypothetical protein
MPWAMEWQPGKVIQVLVFGKAKVGKTFGAYTFPRPVVMDFDRGVAVASNPDFLKKYGRREIFFENFIEKNVTKAGIPLTHNAFDDSCRFFDEWMKPQGNWKGTKVGRDMFDTWILDSGTTMSESAMNKAIILHGSMNLSKTHKIATEQGIIIPKIQDYGSERSLVEQFADMLLESGKHVVFLCHEKEVVDEGGAVLSIEPLLTGKSSEVVPLKFDEVYNLRIKRQGTEFVRYLQTKADGIRKVGSRYGIPNETSWDYGALVQALNKNKQERDALKATGQEPNPASQGQKP